MPSATAVVSARTRLGAHARHLTPLEDHREPHAALRAHEIRPNCTSRRRISLASVVVTRAPVAPNGWPMAIEPPITLNVSRSTSPTRSARPRCVARPDLATRTPGHSRAPARRTPRASRPGPGPSRRCRRARARVGTANAGPISSCSPGSTAATAYAANEGERRVAQCLRGLVAHQQHRRGTVGQRRRVGGRHGAVAPVERRLERGELLERAVRADAVVGRDHRARTPAARRPARSPP